MKKLFVLVVFLLSFVSVCSAKTERLVKVEGQYVYSITDSTFNRAWVLGTAGFIDSGNEINFMAKANTAYDYKTILYNKQRGLRVSDGVVGDYHSSVDHRWFSNLVLEFKDERYSEKVYKVYDYNFKELNSTTKRDIELCGCSERSFKEIDNDIYGLFSCGSGRSIYYMFMKYSSSTNQFLKVNAPIETVEKYFPDEVREDGQDESDDDYDEDEEDEDDYDDDDDDYDDEDDEDELYGMSSKFDYLRDSYTEEKNGCYLSHNVDYGEYDGYVVVLDKVTTAGSECLKYYKNTVSLYKDDKVLFSAADGTKYVDAVVYKDKLIVLGQNRYLDDNYNDELVMYNFDGDLLQTINDNENYVSLGVIDDKLAVSKMYMDGVCDSGTYGNHFNCVNHLGYDYYVLKASNGIVNPDTFALNIILIVSAFLLSLVVIIKSKKVYF